MLNKKSFLVIGGGGLLGSHLTASMLDQGARIIAIDIDLEQMKQKLSLSDVNLTSKKLSLSSIDITDEDAVKKFFSQIDHIDGAVNCSYPRSINYGNSFLNVSQSDFNNNVALHLGSAFLIMRECASYFDKNKHKFSLVNLASIYGSKAPDFSIYEGTNMTMPVEYAAIKSAIIHLNRYVVSFISDSSFRVNSVSPGGLIANQPEKFIDLYKKKTLGKGMLSPDDVIETIIFLLSNASQYINGQDIVVDDGFTL
jgi:NAD(P)-dependent dehydrogenase (short-subunit alcohol dehydrogenase family)